jgi:phage FluMu protein Com
LPERHTLTDTQINLSCVCEHCAKTVSDNIKIELNFASKIIYWYCPECKQMNEIDFKSLKDLKALPKMRLM